MREILIDWLMEVAEEYKLVSDTVYLTVSYIDRFLSSHSINRDKLQLLGVSCMLIASKYEEITPPRADDFCYMTDNCYTKEEHEDLQVEFLSCYIAELCLLDYEFVQFLPSVVASAALFFSRFMIKQHRHPWSKALECYSGYEPSELEECVLAIHGLYLRRNLSSGLTQKYLQHKIFIDSKVFYAPQHEDNLQVDFLSCYIAELCLLDYEFVQFLPSVVASAAFFFSRFIIEQHKHPWSKALECCTGYKPSELEECVLAIHSLYLRRNLSSAVTQKYLKPRFKAVAALSAPSEVPQRYFETAHE
ncbi:hypothetical protein CCACVL1_17050 [Corchorus capsularis]|uniref:Uncharacterized protein n=1 Tax=Corchorus capsularis TaxID=210143 RepID=A0A1R3HUQ5_COCAP|nr:hypothetical protein CCACVL1_17050 [Corchorus capsularis]